NPAEGFYRLRRERFGLVILESSLKAGKSRGELCRRMKALGHGVLITLVTEDGGDTPDILPPEVDLVLKKPLFMDAFQDHIQRLFRGGGPGTILRSEGK
ncbi:MAG: hypothetical protein PVG49_14725, partial [Desulfobacteraceae bacterium]